MTGLLNCFAVRATPIGVLPKILCASIRPSPVMTKSASLTCSASFKLSNTICTPVLSCTLGKSNKPPPIPPAAPAPGCSLICLPQSRPAISAKWANAASSSFTISGVAPFCGPKIAEAPRSPQSGLFTSQATSICTCCNRGSKSAI